jgi:hypothetical protein
MQMKAQGRLEEWPTKATIQRQHDKSGWCQCYSPIPERIAAFNTAQCKKCGKRLPDG